MQINHAAKLRAEARDEFPQRRAPADLRGHDSPRRCVSTAWARRPLKGAAIRFAIRLKPKKTAPKAMIPKSSHSSQSSQRSHSGSQTWITIQKSG